MAFMPFITAGDPDLQGTLALIRELGAAGVDLIEVGFPYSDPIADGPVIQASYTRALGRKLQIIDIFTALESLGPARLELPPLVAMVAYAIIFRTGPQTFLDRAKAAGFSGLIVPDLPGDESEEFAQLVRSAGLDLVQLVAPTTPAHRVAKIVEQSSGFLYCISVAGITGVRDGLPEELSQQLRDLKAKTTLPLAVGFGISRPEHVERLRGLADGVIVGSAIVKQLDDVANGSKSIDDVVAQVGRFAREMVVACRNG